MWRLIIFTICLVVLNANSSAKSNLRIDPLVQTKAGLIRGLHAADGNYAMFLGIPYAHVDEKNPFGDHIIQLPFEESFEAVDDSAMCPQREQFNNTISGTLDCLHLNVYVPTSASSDNKLPVMVWIHGGEFEVGSKRKLLFGPKYLVAHEVIVVAINYRVGPYGFMCLNIPEVPGNQGLKDQQAALKWIKDNIASFGGDEVNIAIFGESAGGASVDLQFRYNKDYTFHKVIMQSGSASGSWAIQEPDYNLAINLANKLGFEAESSLDAVSYLASVHPHLLLAAYQELGLAVWPCAELEFEGVKRFIDDYAMNIKIPKAKTTPILLGVNNDEWLSRYLGRDPEFFETLEIFRQNLNEAFNFSEDDMKVFEDIIKRYYLGGDAVSKEKTFEIAAFDSDFTFIHPAKVSIEEYLANGATTIYSYLFTYSGNRNYGKRNLNTTSGGAVHGDDLGYLFDFSFLDEKSEEDILLTQRMTTMWTNFVKYGNPTPEVTDLIPVLWPKAAADRSNYLKIGTELTVGTTMLHDRMAFWDLIYLLNYTKRKGYRS